MCKEASQSYPEYSTHGSIRPAEQGFIEHPMTEWRCYFSYCGYEIIIIISPMLRDGVTDLVSVLCSFCEGNKENSTAISAWTSIRLLRLEMDRYTLCFIDLYSELSNLLVNFAWLVFDHTLTDYNTELKTHFAEAEDIFAGTCTDPY